MLFSVLLIPFVIPAFWLAVVALVDKVQAARRKKRPVSLGPQYFSIKKPFINAN
jgi:hypothetical protein